MPARISPALQRQLARVKLLFSDVDGVLTDGCVWMGGGIETKRFNIRDGLGMKMLQHCGIKIGWVSRRPSDATRERANDLQIDYLLQGDADKVRAVEAVLREAGLDWPTVCYVGDDVVDLGVLKRAGLGVAVADGVAEARSAAGYVTRAPGGRGAVREVAELILKAQNRWKGIVAGYAE